MPDRGLDLFDGVRVPPGLDDDLRAADPWCERRIPLEVKYRRRIDPHRDTLGLRAFIAKTHYNAPFGALVTMLEDVDVPDPRIVPVSLRSPLLAR
jgi:hypothetical protein